MSGWAVYTRITAREQTEVQPFDDLAEAERFVENRSNWQTPVPVVSVYQPNAPPFSGPFLRTWLKIDRNDDPTKLTFAESCDRLFRDIAPDATVLVMQKLEQEGLIPPADPSAPFGASRYTPAQLKVILNRIGELALPGVRCSLGADWDFITIRLNAEHLGGHVQLLPSRLNLYSLAEVVFDLERALWSRFKGLTNIDIFNFWTSVEVHDHIAEVCRRSVGAMDPRGVELIRDDMTRRLGSYAHTVRSVEGSAPRASSQEPHRTDLHFTVNIGSPPKGLPGDSYAPPLSLAAKRHPYSTELGAVAEAQKTPASVVEPQPQPPPAANGALDVVVPEWAADLRTPQGRKTAREGWKQHWTTPDRDCTNDDLTEAAYSQKDRAFLNQWENATARLKDPGRSSRIQAIERVLRENTPQSGTPLQNRCAASGTN